MHYYFLLLQAFKAFFVHSYLRDKEETLGATATSFALFLSWTGSH